MNKTIPFCSCLYYSANSLARNITRMAEEEFAVTGLTPSYAFIVMRVNNQPGVLIGDLARIMALTPSTVTRLIEKLERKKLLKRITDGKNTKVYPTRSSKNLEITIIQSWQNLHKRYSKLLGEKNGNRLTLDVYNAALKLN
jgi:MarR family transcriptional regulator, organic hydroperoxide resistance regulator